MFDFVISQEKLANLYKATNHKSYDEHLKLIATGECNRAFFGFTTFLGGMISVPVDVVGRDFADKNYSLEHGTKRFIEAAKVGGSVRIVVDNERNTMAIYDCNGIDHNDYSRCVPSLGIEGLHPVAKALRDMYPVVATIKLPKRIENGKAALFDVNNRRVGFYKYRSYIGHDYSVKEIKPLDVIDGYGLACYSGATASNLPWKKGTVAQLLSYGRGTLLLKYELSGVNCLLMPLNPDMDAERYRNVFQNDDDELLSEEWVEEDDDFLTVGGTTR